MNNKELFDFAGAFDSGNVAVKGGVRASLIKTDGGPALLVSVEGALGSPEVEFAAPKGEWDLSNYTHVLVELKNVGDHPLTAHCRVENPNAQAKGVNCVFDLAAALPGGSGIRPGESGSILVELSRKKPEWVKVDVCGMIGRPWSDSPSDQTGERAIEAAHVVKLVVYGMEPAAGCAFEIRSLRAVGRHLAPTELLKDPEKFFPFIDEFGQYIHAEWAGKVHSIGELRANREAEAKEIEAHPGPGDWDQYGGWKKGPSLEATGWFRVCKHDGKWWLVDPEGKLFFSQGMDCVNWTEGTTPVEERETYFRGLPPRGGDFASCYHRLTRPALMGHFKGKEPVCFSFGQANLERKYGAGWKDSYATIAHQRLRSWGLNTIGNWSEPAIYRQSKTPYTVNVRIGGKLLQGSEGYWGKFRDVFDEDFAREVGAAVAAQSQESARDPWCLGYFVDNEIAWGTDEISLAVAALVSPGDQTAKSFFLQDLKAKYATIDKLNAAWWTAHGSWEALLASVVPPDIGKAHDDLAAFHAKTADTYFRVVRGALRQAVPHQLYLGCRFAWHNAAAVAAACRYCDVVSFNIYHRSVANFRLPGEADVPLMIGEFHFGALDRGMFHTGLCPVEAQTQRAAAYQDYVRGMLRHRQFVGGHWFKYMDEPTTGRPTDEENYQVGFLSIADAPYEETIAAAREIGGEMYPYRLGAK